MKMTAEEEVTYVERIRNGDAAAREEFAAVFLDFARDIAHRYASRGVAYEDMESAAFLGLATAIHRIREEGERGAKRFDPSRSRFITYAARWIESCVRRAAAAEMRRLVELSADSITVGAEGDMSLLDCVAVAETAGPHKAAAVSDAVALMQDAMSELLTDVERLVVERRFGLVDGGDTDTLETIGGDLGLTRERVRQIEAGALDKLKRHCVLA